MTYQAIYKCRLCGKNIIALDRKNVTEDEVKIKRDDLIVSHNCNDGSYGIADFQGFELVLGK